VTEEVLPGELKHAEDADPTLIFSGDQV